MASVPHKNDPCTLVIMAKAPRPGTVKTRLARNLSELAVTDLYRCLLDDTIELANGLEGVDVAMVCPECDVEDLARATSNKVRVVAQNGKGLAAGLTSVFAHFASARGGRVVAFNSDTPHLPASVLQNAFSLLAECDVVVGPTRDGGYYLVGATASHPGLFVGDAMGTTSAYEALLGRARALDLSVGLTVPFYDIDEAADLGELAAELQRAPGKAPRTAEWLARAKGLALTEPHGGAA
jgi:uncharacterized protein